MAGGVSDELAPGLEGHLAELAFVRQLALVLGCMLISDLLVGEGLFADEALVEGVVQVGPRVVGQRVLLLERHETHLAAVGVRRQVHVTVGLIQKVGKMLHFGML